VYPSVLGLFAACGLATSENPFGADNQQETKVEQLPEFWPGLDE